MGVLSRYVEDPTVTQDCFQQEPLHYCNADFGGNWDKLKSTPELVFNIAKDAVSWSSKKQCIPVQSTVETESLSNLFAVTEET